MVKKYRRKSAKENFEIILYTLIQAIKQRRERGYFTLNFLLEFIDPTTYESLFIVSEKSTYFSVPLSVKNLETWLNIHDFMHID